MHVDATFSTQDLARLLNINVSTVKRLADGGQLACVKTPGGHRRFRMQDVRAFLQTEGTSPYTLAPIIEQAASAERHDGVGQAILGRQWTQLQTYLVRVASTSGVEEVTRFLVAAHLAGIHPSELCDHVISPAMQQVGRAWATNRITVADEHLVSHTISAALSQVPTCWGDRRRLPYRALCGVLAPDLHEMGCHCVAHVLTYEGWQVRTLGAATPLESFVSSVESHRPSLVCVSATVIYDLVAFRTDCERLAYAASSAGCQIAMGGGAIADRDLRCSHENAVLIRDMGGLVAFVRERFGSEFSPRAGARDAAGAPPKPGASVHAAAE